MLSSPVSPSFRNCLSLRPLESGRTLQLPRRATDSFPVYRPPAGLGGTVWGSGMPPLYGPGGIMPDFATPVSH